MGAGGWRLAVLPSTAVVWLQWGGLISWVCADCPDEISAQLRNKGIKVK